MTLERTLSILLALVAVSNAEFEGIYGNRKHFGIHGEDSISAQLTSAVLMTGNNEQDHKRIAKRQIPSGNGTVVEDSHLYYNSTFISGAAAEDLWFDLAEMIEDNNSNVTRSSLSDQSLVIRFLELPFSFPYYGHLLEFIGITTNGFLYTGTFFHSQIEDYQYIAPLQANFEPGLNETSNVYILSTEERFTVQWDNVFNVDHEDAGPFSFQVSLFPNGEIHFVYDKVPLSISRIESGNFPVRVGISDAYFLTLFVINGISFGYIVEYHSVNLTELVIGDNTAIILRPLPNCIGASNCDECSEIGESTDFDCQWCPQLGRCSDGIDRNRMEWMQNGCHVFSNDEPLDCQNLPTGGPLVDCSSATSCLECIERGSHESTTCRWCPRIGTCTFSYEDLELGFEDNCPVADTSLCSSGPNTTNTPISSSGPNTGAQGGSNPGVGIGVSIFILVLALVVVAVLIIGALLYYGHRRPSSKVGLLMQKHLKYRSSAKEYDIKTERLINESENEL